MVTTSDIEKKNLESHVELCAERYKYLEEKLDTVETKVTTLQEVIREVHDMIQNMSQRRNDQIIAWGTAIIGGLVATVTWLVVNYVIK